MSIIPERIRGFNFVLVNENSDTGKKPIEDKWTKRVHRFNDPKLLNWLSEGHSYGILCGNTSPIIIDKESYFLVVIDFDRKEFQDKILPLLPETFTVSSNSPKNCVHLYFASDDERTFSIVDEKCDTLADVRGEGAQVVAPGSKHKSGSIYSVIKDIPFAFIPFAEIEAILKPYDKRPKKEKKIKIPIVASINNDVASKAIAAVSMEEILKDIGINTNKNPTNCFGHSSKGGQCFSWDNERAHCFHCQSLHDGWNKFSLIREAKKLTDKETFEWFAEKAGMLEQLKKARKEYKEKEKQESHIGVNGAEIFSRIGQAESFYKIQPYYWSPEGLLYYWNKERYCYEIKDETDLLNGIRNSLNYDTIDGQKRFEILQAIKQVGREKRPMPKPKHWIQFQDTLVDIKTGERFKATSEYFLTNPIPHRLGNSENTPVINKLFREWVVKEKVQNESYIKTLEEATAYSLSEDLFLQRLIAATGSGLNGKGTWFKLIQKLVGEDNCVSVEIKKLSINNFAMSAIYKKLVAFSGEVSYNDLSNTNNIKKLTGEDLIEFEFKGKTSFTDKSITTFIIGTNSLPITPDKSIGFYRRWLIIDFPNQFEIKPDILSNISETEYENFCLKCVNVLKGLYESKKFTNEGSILERENKYEERSNPLPKFIQEETIDEPGERIKLQEFCLEFNTWLRNKQLKVVNVRQLGNMLRTEGYEIGKRKEKRKEGEDSFVDSFVAVLNLKLKNTDKT